MKARWKGFLGEDLLNHFSWVWLLLALGFQLYLSSPYIQYSRGGGNDV